MKSVLLLLFFFFHLSSQAQTILSATPQYATAGDHFTMTVVMSGTVSNPYNIRLISATTTLAPWSSGIISGSTYSVSYLLRDYELVGNYYVTYGASTYPVPVRINRRMVPEKFSFLSAQALIMNVSSITQDGIRSMTTDSYGNVYAVGGFTGINSVGTPPVLASGYRDGFIAKFDSAGTLKWMRTVGSSIDINLTNSENLTSIELYQDTVVYVTGLVMCDTSLKYNGSTPIPYPVRNQGTQDGLVMRIDSAGNFMWAAFQGSMKNDATSEIEVDANGLLYVSGYAQSDDFFNSGINDTSFTYVYNNGATDSIALGAYCDDQYGLFLARYTAAGQLIWAKRQNRDYFIWGSYPVGMKLCSDNSLVILSKGQGEVTWDNFSCSSSCCNMHYNIMKVDSSGNRIWCLEDGNYSNSMNLGIDSTDNIYVTTTTTIGGGESATFLRKYSPTGAQLWSKPVQQNKDNAGNYVSVTDRSGNTYIGHAYQHLWAGNARAIVTKKFNPSGDMIAVTFPNPQTPQQDNSPNAIALNKNQDKIYLAGTFKNLQRFGNTTLNSTTTKPFFVRMENCLMSYDSITVSSCGPYVSPSGNHIWNTSGLYSDTLVNSVGCDSIVLITLTVNANPVVSVTALGSTTFCQGDSVILSATAGMTTYQWYKHTWPISGATSPTYTAKSRGVYFCIAQDAGLCPDSSNNITVSVPCISFDPPVDKIHSSLDPENRISVYPNPGNGIFNITAPAGVLEVYDPLGNLITRKEHHQQHTTINLSLKPKGMYLIRLIHDKGSITERLILIE